MLSLFAESLDPTRSETVLSGRTLSTLLELSPTAVDRMSRLNGRRLDMKNSKSFYDRISKAYDLIADAGEHKTREAGLEALAVRDGEQVLEIGCGTGHGIVELAKAVGARGRIVGLDLSEGMLEVARKRVKAAGFDDRTELQLGDARDLSLEGGRFDAAFMSFTLELFDPDQIPSVLTQVRRVLKVDGRLGVVSLAYREPPTPITEIYQWLHRHFPHFIDCQPIEAETLIRDAGFRIQAAIDMSIWGLPVVSVTATR